tara:strand:+ start:463 stop:666 length:204 start_codon:yes stop_codon:yes gene_type:complete
MNNNLFRINRELDWKRNAIINKIKKQCKSKYPIDENKRNGKIEKILRNYEEYIFELSKLKIGVENEI